MAPGEAGINDSFARQGPKPLAPLPAALAVGTRTSYSFGMNDAITWNAPDGDNPARRVSQRSLDCVSRKAKDEWLELFAEDAVLEDPVGPSFFDPEGQGHHGREGISAFWDLAIAPLVEFHATISDSFANGNNVANVGVFSTLLADGTRG